MGLSIGIGLSIPMSGGIFDAVPITLYYVDQTGGSDTNDGLTTGTAWKTASKVMATTFTAPSWVLFKGGETWAEDLILTAARHNGTAGKKNIFGAYGTGKPTFNAQGNTSKGLYAADPAYVTITDMIFVGTGITTSSAFGVHVTRTATGAGKNAGVSLVNLDVTAFGSTGIQVDNTAASGTAGFNGLLIDGCTSYANGGNCADEGGNGINVSGEYGTAANPYTHTNVTIQNCIAHGNTGKTGLTNWSGSGIFMAQTDVGLIYNCLAYNNGENGGPVGGGGPVGIWTADARAVVIRNCSSYENKCFSGAYDGSGFDLDGGAVNCIIEYCYSRDNYGPGYMMYQYDDIGVIPPLSGNHIRYNISENDAPTAALTVGSIMLGNDQNEASPNNYVYNNTVYVNYTGAVGLQFLSATHNEQFTNGGVFNNIFFVRGTSSKLIKAGTNLPAVTFLMEANLYFTGSTLSIDWNGSTYTSVATWKTASGKEALNAEVLTNPTFAGPVPAVATGAFDSANFSGYQLNTISPARQAGLNLNSLYGITIPATDVFGNTVPVGSSFDIGAFDGVASVTNLITAPTNIYTTWFVESNYTMADGYDDNIGGLTATRALETAVSGSHQIARDIYGGGNTPSVIGPLPAGDYVYTADVKSIGRDYIQFTLFDAPNYAHGVGGIFKFSDQTWTSGGIYPYGDMSSLVKSSIDLGNGWYRISLAFTVTSTISSGFASYLRGSDTGAFDRTYLGDITKGFYVREVKLVAA